jgi:hypothetical protein
MDKEELKRQIKLNSHLEYDKVELRPAFVYVPVVIDLIDQLDEPEKPVIPQFVGEWIENAKEDECSLSKAFWLIFSNAKDTGGNITENWIYTNPELFARAWLAYPNIEVEKEKKYYVIEPTTGQFLIRDFHQSNGVKWVDGFSSDPESYNEQEIKDYDERFWPFAVPVEEGANE